MSSIEQLPNAQNPSTEVISVVTSIHADIKEKMLAPYRERAKAQKENPNTHGGEKKAAAALLGIDESLLPVKDIIFETKH